MSAGDDLFRAWWLGLPEDLRKNYPNSGVHGIETAFRAGQAAKRFNWIDPRKDPEAVIAAAAAVAAEAEKPRADNEALYESIRQMRVALGLDPPTA